MATINECGNTFVVDYYDTLGKRRRERKRTRKAAKDRFGQILKATARVIETCRTVKEY